ncbi:MAG TPA: hypothetical protein VNI20_05435 [Fimbriimonadaceae bacterium]|nr:hypothetical protein [Fimbriimonadaceae bacterium]
MPDLDRSSNIKEIRTQRALMAMIPGGIGLFIAIVLFSYHAPSTIGLRWVMLLASVGALGYGIWQLSLISKITTFDIVCPFCDGKNIFTEQPMDDVRCDHCNREIPIVNGRLLKVFQVRCGYCNALNWYSEKSTGLICEECDRVIPISTEEGQEATAAFTTFSRQDDDAPYNLMLIDAGPKHEEIIPVLQKMLALNRNQVKDIIDEVPVILLQGIPKKKADLLAAQIGAHDGRAKVAPTP